MSPSARNLLCAICAAVLVAGCDDPNKRIRELQADVAKLQAENDRLKVELTGTSRKADELRNQIAILNSLPVDRWAMIPKPATVTIDGKSGLRTGKPQLDNSPTTQPTAGPVDKFVRLYVQVFDADNYAMHAVGAMKISLFDLAGAQPRSLGVYPFDARHLDRHYRTALTADLFAFDLPLTAAPAKGSVTVRIEFVDYLTGKTLTAEKGMK
ncbi:MAG: bZIP transcription factor [Phycisphaerae bacterium]|nr:bZIP transcription factor [Phycisphaerae bacterium]